ncbi:MAG: hypothetical protein J5596_01705 [Bacteroidaceae bacterium]|nr:hypothetical protein [Bacteroidaceae bacterium]
MFNICIANKERGALVVKPVLQLKGMGFSLEEIRELYEDDTHVPGIDATLFFFYVH